MVDSKDAQESIAKTDEKASSLGDKLSGGVKTAAKWGAAVAGAAVAAGTAMVAAAKDTADVAGEIDDAAQRIGIDAENYQKLAYAAKLNGVEMSTMEKAAKKLVGTDMSLDEALANIMSLGTETERTQAAIEMFGDKVAYDMQPLLKAGGESFYELQQEAVDLGAVMSNEAVESGAQMGDMFDKIDSSLSTLKNGLVAELMPYVMEILQWVIDNIPMIKETVGKTIDTLIPIVKPILDAIMKMLPPLLELIQKILDAIMPILEPVLKYIISAVEAVVALLSGDLEGFGDKIKEMFHHYVDIIKSVGTLFFNAGKAIFTKLWDGIKNVWESITGWVTEKVSWLVDKVAFWKNDDEADGSHASGLPFVPYDNYKAVLHRGETVLSADSTTALVDKLSQIAGGGDQTINIVLDGEIVSQSLVRRMQREVRMA